MERVDFGFGRDEMGRREIRRLQDSIRSVKREKEDEMQVVNSLGQLNLSCEGQNSCELNISETKRDDCAFERSAARNESQDGHGEKVCAKIK